jgi:hypothetical protein
MDQPITCQENRSMTALKYSQSSCVRRLVMSVTRADLGLALQVIAAASAGVRHASQGGGAAQSVSADPRVRANGPPTLAVAASHAVTEPKVRL